MVFFSRSCRPAAVAVACGKGYAPQYEERIGSDGALHLVKVGQRDVHTFIQEGKERTLVYNILNRFSQGDISAIQRVKGYYADVTAMPKSLLEVHNFMKSLDSNFDSLPAEVKAKFGNSSTEFMKSVENGELTKILNTFLKNDSVFGSGSSGSEEKGSDN